MQKPKFLSYLLHKHPHHLLFSLIIWSTHYQVIYSTLLSTHLPKTSITKHILFPFLPHFNFCSVPFTTCRLSSLALPPPLVITYTTTICKTFLGTQLIWLASLWIQRFDWPLLLLWYCIFCPKVFAGMTYEKQKEFYFFLLWFLQFPVLPDYSRLFGCCPFPMSLWVDTSLRWCFYTSTIMYFLTTSGMYLQSSPLFLSGRRVSSHLWIWSHGISSCLLRKNLIPSLGCVSFLLSLSSCTCSSI